MTWVYTQQIIVSLKMFNLQVNYENSYLKYEQDNHRQTIVNYIDFTLKGILQQAITDNEYWRLRDSNNNSTGANGWYPSNIVTFVDNHDTLGLSVAI